MIAGAAVENGVPVVLPDCLPSSRTMNLASNSLSVEWEASDVEVSDTAVGVRPGHLPFCGSISFRVDQKAVVDDAGMDGECKWMS